MKKLNNKGFTLLELLVSVIVSSIVISVLIQMLTMSVQARNSVQVESRLKDESYFLVEQLRYNIFDLETQSVTISETTNEITVTFNHDYTMKPLPSGAIGPDYTEAVSETLVYNKSLKTITYNGNQMHSDNVSFETGTTFSLTPVDSTCVPTTESCTDVILVLTLVVSIELSDGTKLENRVFETTIII